MNVSAEQVVEYRKGGFRVSSDRSRLNIQVIHEFLTNCYWAKGIPESTVARSIANSLCFGVYDSEKQVGFARVISDFATFAYLGDVFVLETYRGLGLGKWLLECIFKHPLLAGLRRWALVTRDAHGLYAQSGFTPLRTPDRWMEIHDPSVYEVCLREIGSAQAAPESESHST